MERVFIFGIDGATFDLINPLIDKGKLPNLEKLVKEGCKAVLHSTTPPNSSVAWTSLMTGVNPGKHGIFYFLQQERGTYGRRYINASSIKAETLWSRASRSGLKTGVVNMPMTYPPEEVNGFIVAGMLSPSLESVFTWPPSLHAELVSQVGHYPLDHTEAGGGSAPDRLYRLKRLFEEQEERARAVEYLIDRKEWDIFAAVFTITDRLQHVGWRFHDVEYAERYPEETAVFGNLIEEAYCCTDRILGRLLSIIPPRTLVVVVSDHGFGPIIKNFHVGRWLMKEGFLRRSGKPAIHNLPGRAAFGRSFPFLRFRKLPPWENVDWSNTGAYPAWAGGEEIIQLNLKSREPFGSVDKGEESLLLKRNIVKKLMELVDPDTGRNVVENAWLTEDIYSGPHLDLAPDIQYETSGCGYHTLGDIDDGPILEKPEHLTPALHNKEGILILHGPECGVRTGSRLGARSIMDIAPTVLRHFSIPVPPEMDGEPVREAFSEAYNSQKEDFSVSTGDKPGKVRGEIDFTEEEAAIIEKQLKGLGYIE